MRLLMVISQSRKCIAALSAMLRNLQEQQRLYGALYALRLMTRKYEFRDAEERIPLETIVQTTFPTLLQVFQVRTGCLALFSQVNKAVQHLEPCILTHDTGNKQ